MTEELKAPTPAELIAFLNGEAPLEGRWFGDTEPLLRNRMFWWRKYLPILSPPAADAGEVRKLREALIECGRAAACILADDVSTDFLLLVPAEVKAALLPSRSYRQGIEDAAKVADEVAVRWGGSMLSVDFLNLAAAIRKLGGE